MFSSVTRTVLILMALTARARAQDEFEIQVYDVETAHRGEPGLEVHVNYHLIHDAADALHVTFEPHYGLRSWLELGGYFQTSLDTSGDFEYAGVKLRAKMRWPRRLWQDRLGLAMNVEASAVPAQFEANVWGSELRPIADLRVGRVYAAINPIVDVDLHGALRGSPSVPAGRKACLGRRVHDVRGGGVRCVRSDRLSRQ